MRWFASASSFNGDISSWNTGSVTNMQAMFYNASSFNADISGWNTGSVDNMMGMFYMATSFNRDLGGWDVADVEDMMYMFNGTALTAENYSKTLVDWSDLTLQNNVTLGASCGYTADAADERQSIIDTYGWTISDAGEVTPVELTSFDGDYVAENVELIWETATEVNNYGFEVERQYRVSSSEYGDWEKIGFVEGHGTVNIAYSYSFVDSTLPAVDTVSYRLKQVDLGGSYEYSKEIKVAINNLSVTGVEDEDLPSEFGLSQNYPNPFNPTTSIEYRVSSSENVSIKIYDMLGREVMTLVNEVKSPGTYNVKMYGANLASGVYIYRMTSGDYVSVKKFMLMK